MPEITVKVRDKIAQTEGTPEIVNGNSDYTVTFDFDAAWDGAENLTAHIRYLRGGLPVHDAIPITDGACNLPAVYGTDAVQIGVSGGSIQTSTPAAVPCLLCAADLPGVPARVPRDIFSELMRMLNQKLSPIVPGTHEALLTYSHAELSHFTHAELASLHINL